MDTLGLVIDVPRRRGGLSAGTEGAETATGADGAGRIIAGLGKDAECAVLPRREVPRASLQ